MSWTDRLKFWGRKKNVVEETIRIQSLPSGQIVRYERFSWKKLFQKKRYIPWWILLALIIAATVLMSIYHEEIVKWLQPTSEKIRDLSWGWVIPILILFVISYPPLIGHEIVALLCGIIYGLWIGFGIVAAGTFLGEIGTYYAFKGFLRHRAEKEERRNLNYGCLATISREGGFWFIFIARLSAIPGHVTTAIFATCGVKLWHFLLATLLTLPKQLIVVYLGVIIHSPDNTHLISNVVLGITFVITVLAAVYIYMKMRKVRDRLLDIEEIMNSGDKTFRSAYPRDKPVDMSKYDIEAGVGYPQMEQHDTEYRGRQEEEARGLLHPNGGDHTYSRSRDSSVDGYRRRDDDSTDIYDSRSISKHNGPEPYPMGQDASPYETSGTDRRRFSDPRELTPQKPYSPL